VLTDGKCTDNVDMAGWQTRKQKSLTYSCWPWRWIQKHASLYSKYMCM